MNAMDVISRAYPDEIAQVQTVVTGDGKELSQIRWSAMTPEFSFACGGSLQAYQGQRVILELQARVDFSDRTLDERFKLVTQVLEDFCAWGQPGATNGAMLKDVLTSSESAGVAVDSVTPEAGSEGIENNDFVVTYRLNCLIRQK
jgi:hypothetical protein